MRNISNKIRSKTGKIGYLILWLMGTPITLLLILWVVLGDNIFGPG